MEVKFDLVQTDRFDCSHSEFKCALCDASFVMDMAPDYCPFCGKMLGSVDFIDDRKESA